MTVHHIACVGHKQCTDGKLRPFFIIRNDDGTWDENGKLTAWELKANAGVVYTIDGDFSGDQKLVQSSTLRFKEYWPNHSLRRQWVAQSEAAKLDHKAKKQTANATAKAKEVLDDLNVAYWSTPPNLRAAFLAYVISEITRG